jgi:hypothetical protein
MLATVSELKINEAAQQNIQDALTLATGPNSELYTYSYNEKDRVAKIQHPLIQTAREFNAGTIPYPNSDPLIPLDTNSNEVPNTKMPSVLGTLDILADQIPYDIEQQLESFPEHIRRQILSFEFRLAHLGKTLSMLENPEYEYFVQSKFGHCAPDAVFGTKVRIRSGTILDILARYVPELNIAEQVKQNKHKNDLRIRELADDPLFEEALRLPKGTPKPINKYLLNEACSDYQILAQLFGNGDFDTLLDDQDFPNLPIYDRHTQTRFTRRGVKYLNIDPLSNLRSDRFVSAAYLQILLAKDEPTKYYGSLQKVSTGIDQNGTLDIQSVPKVNERGQFVQVVDIPDIDLDTATVFEKALYLGYLTKDIGYPIRIDGALEIVHATPIQLKNVVEEMLLDAKGKTAPTEIDSQILTSRVITQQMVELYKIMYLNPDTGLEFLNAAGIITETDIQKLKGIVKPDSNPLEFRADFHIFLQTLLGNETYMDFIKHQFFHDFNAFNIALAAIPYDFEKEDNMNQLAEEFASHKYLFSKSEVSLISKY